MWWYQREIGEESEVEGRRLSAEKGDEQMWNTSGAANDHSSTLCSALCASTLQRFNASSAQPVPLLVFRHMYNLCGTHKDNLVVWMLATRRTINEVHHTAVEAPAVRGAASGEAQ